MFEYSYIKALHIIFVVNWFAGLFYMPRLFIYTREAFDKPEPEKSILIRQFKIMQQKLWYIIAWPACVITVLLGTTLLLKSPAFFTQGWMQLKLLFVLLLLMYHLSLHYIFKQQQVDKFTYTSIQLRIWNEVATIFLFAIVFLVVIKTKLSLLTGFISLFLLVILLMLGIKLYALIRNRK